MIIHTQSNGKIPRSGVIDQQTIDPHYLCYQCSKDSQEFLFGKQRIRDPRYEPYFPAQTKSISCQNQMNNL